MTISLDRRTQELIDAVIAELSERMAVTPPPQLTPQDVIYAALEYHAQLQEQPAAPEPRG